MKINSLKTLFIFTVISLPISAYSFFYTYYPNSSYYYPYHSPMVVYPTTSRVVVYPEVSTLPASTTSQYYWWSGTSGYYPYTSYHQACYMSGGQIICP